MTKRALGLILTVALAAFFGAVLAAPLPALGADLNDGPPTASAAAGVVTKYDAGKWSIGPQFKIEGDAAVCLGESSCQARAFAEVTFGLRTGEAEAEVGAVADEAAAASPVDLVNANAIRTRAGLKRAIGRREYPSADPSKGPLRVTTSLFVEGGAEWVVDRETQIAPRFARALLGGIWLEVERDGETVGEFKIEAGLDESARPAEPVPGPDGTFGRSVQIASEGLLPIVRRGAVSGKVYARLVSSAPRLEGYRDSVEVGVRVQWGD